MWKYLVGGLLLLVTSLAVSSNSAPGPWPYDGNYSDITDNQSVVSPPVCLIDLECGESGYSDYYCLENFVMWDNSTYRCVGGGLKDAKCVNHTKQELVDWCRPDEICVKGKGICQPRPPTCLDGLRNNGENGIDCGGPCKSCTSCNDGVRNGDETGIDCGGSCPDCVIQCTSNDSCGIPRWGPTYCGMDGSVYQDYVDFECRNPGKYSSYCTQHRMMRISDYCGPLNRCSNGSCVDKGFRGQLHVPPYTCEAGQPCFDDGEVIVTCKGDWCFKVRIPFDESNP